RHVDRRRRVSESSVLELDLDRRGSELDLVPGDNRHAHRIARRDIHCALTTDDPRTVVAAVVEDAVLAAIGIPADRRVGPADRAAVLVAVLEEDHMVLA